MQKVKMQKGRIVKIVPVEYKKDYISLGYVEVKEQNRNTTGVNSTMKYGNKY